MERCLGAAIIHDTPLFLLPSSLATFPVSSSRLILSRALLLTLHRDSTPTVNAFSDRLATPMDTRVSPLERGEERNGEKTESEELEGTESHRGGEEKKRRGRRSRGL